MTNITIPQAEYEQLLKDAELGKLIRSKLVSGNSVPVSRCHINLTEVEAIDKAMEKINEQQ